MIDLSNVIQDTTKGFKGTRINGRLAVSINGSDAREYGRRLQGTPDPECICTLEECLTKIAQLNKGCR